MLDFADIFTAAGLIALGQVILIDLTMAGDNVVIIGTLTSGLPPRERRRVIMLGVAMALAFLIAFALIATRLLRFTGLLLAGGLLLLWVAYNMVRQLRPRQASAADDPSSAKVTSRSKTLLRAAVQVTVADLSMSLDNVLAVAAAARDHPAVLFIGLALSVTLMGLAANLVARIVERFPWIAWAGLAMILYVACRMIWEGAHKLSPAAALWF